MSIESVILSNHLILCCSLLYLLSVFPNVGSFPVSRLFAADGQSIGASVLVLPVNSPGWFSLGLTGLVSLQSKGLSRVFSRTTTQKHQFFSTQPSSWSNSPIHRFRAHRYWNRHEAHEPELAFELSVTQQAASFFPEPGVWDRTEQVRKQSKGKQLIDCVFCQHRDQETIYAHLKPERSM